MYPVRELELLRDPTPLVSLNAAPLAPGITPLAGVNSSQLDLELIFDWGPTGAKAIPEGTGLEVGVQVLVGSDESTFVGFRLDSGPRFDNGTKAVGRAVALGVDTSGSRADRKVH